MVVLAVMAWAPRLTLRLLIALRKETLSVGDYLETAVAQQPLRDLTQTNSPRHGRDRSTVQQDQIWC